MNSVDSFFARHHRATRVIHWSTVAAAVLGIGAIFLREYIESRPLKLTLLSLHQGMGLFVLAFAISRIALYWPLGVSKINAFLPSRVRLVSSLGHIALYLGLLCIPVLGWLLTSARGQTAYFAWLIPLPGLTERDRDFADTVQDWHVTGAWILLTIAVLHISAALFHHFVLKDSVLRSMLPPGKPVGAAVSTPATILTVEKDPV